MKMRFTKQPCPQWVVLVSRHICKNLLFPLCLTSAVLRKLFGEEDIDSTFKHDVESWNETTASEEAPDTEHQTDWSKPVYEKPSLGIIFKFVFLGVKLFLKSIQE